MLDNHYVNPKLARVYDLDSPWSIDRDFYYSLAGLSPKRILDLGCGTGILCHAYAAAGHNVTGVDPALAMLEVARRKLQGKRIKWVLSSAQDFRSDTLFDLIIMTGHTFQVLLTDDDVSAAMNTMHRQLKPDGVIVFESRNPAFDWDREWDYDMVFQLPQGQVTETRRFLRLENERLSFELRYQFGDETLISRSILRFMSQTDIQIQLAMSRLQVDKLLGGWRGQPFDEQSSREMIFIVSSAI